MVVPQDIENNHQLDSRSFEKLFREYFSPLMSFALKILGNDIWGKPSRKR